MCMHLHVLHVIIVLYKLNHGYAVKLSHTHFLSLFLSFLFSLFPPRFAMDIALLNLANVLHRSKHSLDATVPLHVAISLAPNVNVLHYTLGNIYAVSTWYIHTYAYRERSNLYSKLLV